MYIGQISELSGYSQRMIRYLEDQGLLVPERSDSNLRRFSDQNLTRILKTSTEQLFFQNIKNFFK
jgi:DNA-binding transcriptional MerR regulator